MFDNLLNNAVKYGKDGKLIQVEMERKENTVVARVINYGYVIPANELGNLFRNFTGWNSPGPRTREARDWDWLLWIRSPSFTEEASRSAVIWKELFSR